MSPRLLSETEFKATFSDRMVDINGREDLVSSEGVIDLEPYLRAAESSMVPVELLPDVPPSAVYRTSDDRFDHVLYRCNRSNMYMVVVVALRQDDVYGHYLLDLGKEYDVSTDTKAV